MSFPAADAGRRLRTLCAKARLKLVVDSESSARLAQDLLEVGFDSPSLRMLAGVGLDSPSVAEVVGRVCEELGVDPMTEEQATIVVAVDLARRVLLFEVNVDVALREIQQLSARMQKYGPFDVLDTFVFISDLWEDYPERRQEYEPAIRGELERFVTDHRPGTMLKNEGR